MPFFPTASSPGFSLQIATAAAGFQLVNGTPNIISYTTPNDGLQHRFLVFCTLRITTATETGGQVNLNWTDPSNTAATVTLYASALTVGAKQPSVTTLTAAPNTTVTIAQGVALTGTAVATLYAELWGS